MKRYENIVNAFRDIAVKGKEPKIDITDILIDSGCYSLLKKCATSYISKETVSTLVKKNQEEVRLRYTDCEKLFYELNSSGISYVVMKGAVLSQMLYDNPYLRVSHDIDLLVDRKDSSRVDSIMKQCGFIQGKISGTEIVPYNRQKIVFEAMLTHQLAPYVKKNGNKPDIFTNVDVNVDVLWGEAEEVIDIQDVLLQTETIIIAGVRVNKLIKEMEFIAMCLHHYKDMNSLFLLSKKSMSIRLFLDIYFYLKNNNLNLDKLVDISKRYNISKYVYYCLNFTYQLFEDEILIPYLCQFEFAREVHLLKSYGLNEKERLTWNNTFWERIFDNNMQLDMENVLPEPLQEKIEINKRMILNEN